MTTIYDQFDKAFSKVSGFVCLKDNAQLNVSIKHPKNGVGRLAAYVHMLGNEMVKGVASGYGYDKTSAAVSQACGKINIQIEDNGAEWRDQLISQGWKVYRVI